MEDFNFTFSYVNRSSKKKMNGEENVQVSFITINKIIIIFYFIYKKKLNRHLIIINLVDLDIIFTIYLFIYFC